jgi:hypothetical protein
MNLIPEQGGINSHQCGSGRRLPLRTARSGPGGDTSQTTLPGHRPEASTLAIASCREKSSDLRMYGCGGQASLIEDVKLTVIEGSPHAIAWTRSDQVNMALLSFLRS